MSQLKVHWKSAALQSGIKNDEAGVGLHVHSPQKETPRLFNLKFKKWGVTFFGQCSSNEPHDPPELPLVV